MTPADLARYELRAAERLEDWHEHNGGDPRDLEYSQDVTALVRALRSAQAALRGKDAGAVNRIKRNARRIHRKNKALKQEIAELQAPVADGTCGMQR